MKLKIYLITTLIGALLAGVFCFVDTKMSMGILLSTGYSLVNMLLLSLSMKATLKQDNVNFSILISGNILRFFLMAVVIYIAVRNPQIFNMVGVAIGFTLFLGALLIDALTRKGR